MSWEHAKALTRFLEDAVSTYEERVGKLPDVERLRQPGGGAMTTLEKYPSSITSLASTAAVSGELQLVRMSHDTPVLTSLTTDNVGGRRDALLEDLIAWATDPEIDRSALEHVDRDAWGLER